MHRTTISKALFRLGLLGAHLLGAAAGRAQGTGFTYQGTLADGSAPASGAYDFRFLVFDAATEGAQVGAATEVSALSVVDGVFTAVVDPGPGVFTGASRWLQIDVRTNGAPAYVSIVPRHLLAAAPYALHAASSAIAQSVPASGITGVLPQSALPAAAITNGAAGVTLSGVFTGDGSGLTGLGAARWVDGARVATAPGESLVLGGTSPVEIILPPTAEPGARIRISGVGPGVGILHGNIVGHAIGENWIQRAPTGNLPRVASSGDGSRLGVTAASGRIQISTDGGATWTPRGIEAGWAALTCSTDGLRWVANSSSGVFLSSDGGTNWSPSSTPVATRFHVMASSASGAIVYGADPVGALHRSSDYGATWVTLPPPLPTQPLTDVATTADGQQVGVVADGAYLRISRNGGMDWDSVAGRLKWSSISCSDDGSRWLAAQQAILIDAEDHRDRRLEPGRLYVSVDGGNTWVPRGPEWEWTRTTSSADGSILTATGNSGRLAVSLDGGLTWNWSGPSSWWVDLVCTRSGFGLAALARYVEGVHQVVTSMPWSLGSGDPTELVFRGDGLRQPVVPAGIDAARIVTGTLSEARLSLNVALRAGGNVGLGTVVAATGLHVKQRTDNSGFNAANDGIRLESVSGHYWPLQTQAGGDLVFDSGLGTGYACLSINGGNIHITSDARLKKNVRPLEALLDRALRLEPVTFQYRTAPDDSPPIVGFIARQVRPLFPEVVDEKDGTLALSYAGFGPIAIGALRELHARFEEDRAELARRLAARDARIADLETRLERLERALAAGTPGSAR